MFQDIFTTPRRAYVWKTAKWFVKKITRIKAIRGKIEGGRTVKMVQSLRKLRNCCFAWNWCNQTVFIVLSGVPPTFQKKNPKNDRISNVFFNNLRENWRRKGSNNGPITTKLETFKIFNVQLMLLDHFYCATPFNFPVNCQYF